MPYHNIDFTKLTKIDKRVVLDSIYYNTTTNEEFDLLNDKLNKLDIHNFVGTDEEAVEYEDYVYVESNKIFKEKAKIINKLVEEKASFIVAFHASEDTCTSTAYGDPYHHSLKFMKNHNIYIYDANLTSLKNTVLYEKVKYASTVIVVEKGEIIAYTDKNNDEFKSMYRENGYEPFEKWLESIVKVK